MKRLVLVTALTGLFTAFLPLTAVAHDAPNRCGHKRGVGAGWDRLRGHGVACDKARRIARRWERKCIHRGPCPKRRAVKIWVKPGFRCRYGNIAGFEGVRVRCIAAGIRIVHFRWGS